MNAGVPHRLASQKEGFNFDCSCSLLLLLFCVALLVLSPIASAETEPKRTIEVTHFSPIGISTDVRQVRATFSSDVVPFADPRMHTDVFSIVCDGPDAGPADQPKGSARWADPQNWVYDFESDLPAGTRCEFPLNPTFVPISGSPITIASALPATLGFHTGGPIVTRVTPWPGSQIAEDQAFILTLNGKYDRRSLKREVFFSTDTVENRIPIELIEGQEREQLLKEEIYDEQERRNGVFAIVQPTQRLTHASKVNLVWGKNVSAPNGETSPQDQVFSFSVRMPFELNILCERTSADAGCIPLRPLTVSFTSPADARDVRAMRLQTADGRMLVPEIAPGSEQEKFLSDISFKGPFAPGSTVTLSLPNTRIRDDSGRALEPPDSDDLSVTFADYPPLVKFAAPFSLVEWDGESTTPQAAIPVTVRDVEPELLARLINQEDVSRYMRSGVQSLPVRVARIQAIPEMQRIINGARWQSHDESMFGSVGTGQDATPLVPNIEVNEQRIPRPHPGKSFEVMGIPVSKPGFYAIEVESPRLAETYQPRGNRFFVRSTALVTNLAVHFRWGKDRSLAWVTSINSGLPAKGARLAAVDCTGKVLWEGRSDAQGLAYPQNLPAPTEYNSACTGSTGIYLSAALGEDFSFTSSNWDDGIEPWRFGVPVDYSTSNEVAHTVFAENLVRRDSTVHMKHYLRVRGGAGLSPLARSKQPTTAILRHQGSDETVEIPLHWRNNGTAESSWAVPPNAKIGSYSVSLRISKEPLLELRSGTFKVDDFKVPLMLAQVKAPAGIQVSPASLPFQFLVTYASGGAASKLPVLARHTYQNNYVTMGEDYSEYRFLAGPVREGIVRSDQSERYESNESEDSSDAAALPRGVTRNELVLDEHGAGTLSVQPAPDVDRPYQVATELEYRDPNGEIQTTSSSAQVWPSSLALGIKALRWTGQNGKVSVEAIALSDRAAPLPGVSVSITLFQAKTFSHRTRLVGGFYAYESSTETTRVADLCTGTSDDRGVVRCEQEGLEAGEYLIEARARDSNGRLATTSTSTWVTGDDALWFEQSQSDRVDLLAEKRVYEIGQDARIQIRSPFQKATALISVEREGVIDAFLREVEGTDPVITLPIRNNYAPNVFVSVLLTRGRIGEVQPTALLDLGKPAVRLGIVELKVSRVPHQLHVKVSTDRDVYNVRDTAEAKIIVQAVDKTALNSDAEVAIAVVDEALLELQANDSWDILEGMLGRRANAVRTSSALLHLVGKRHFGLKAMPSGGGGGKSNTRELFDTLLLWKDAVRLSPAGVATVSIPLNDSLSRFRVVAIASSGEGKFGSGHASFATSQDLMVLPGVLPVAREGDETTVEATLRNTTERPITVRAMLSAARIGRSTEGGAALALSEAVRTVQLPGGSSGQVSWPVLIPPDTKAMQYHLSVSEQPTATSNPTGESASELIRDEVKLSQRVEPAVRATVIQSLLQQVEGDFSVPVQAPQDAVAGLGGIRVAFRRSLVDGSEGLRDYMRSYPYTCLEQRVSRAVTLDSKEEWRKITADLPARIDSRGLLKYFPQCVDGSADLTAYVASISHAAEFEIPLSLRDQILRALSAVAAGDPSVSAEREVASGSGRITQQRIAALEALSRYGQADQKVIDTLLVDIRTLPTLSLLQWWTVLDKAPGLTDRASRLSEVTQALHARLNYQGTMLMLSSPQADNAWWFMSSVDRALNQLILAALDHGISENAFARSDIPKLVRGAIERQHGGAWDLTTANAWGALMLRQYSRAFENSPVSGISEATLVPANLNNGSSSSTTATESIAIHSQPSSMPFYSVDWSKVVERTHVAPTQKGIADTDALVLTPFLPGPSTLTLSHRPGRGGGLGAPWAFVQSVAAIPLREPLSSGYRVQKSLRALERAHPERWSVGDILEVTLKLTAQADRTWVVIDDPIPAGARIIGTNKRSQSLVDQNRTTQVDEDADRTLSWVWPVFTEPSFDSYRAYFDYFPKGDVVLSYSLRLNSPGNFNLPPTRAEAMYSPEMFGELPNEPMQIWEVTAK